MDDTEKVGKAGAIAIAIVLIISIIILASLYRSCAKIFDIEPLTEAEREASSREDRRIIEEHRKTKQLHEDLHYLYGDEIYDK